MRIAQISPLIESVPPKTYGGTERIVSFITEELVRRGHQVTLFASGDSQTAATLVPVTPMALRALNSEKRNSVDGLAYHMVEIEEAVSHSGEFDILHFHIDYLHFPVSHHSEYAHVTTLHGRLDIEGLDFLYKKYYDIPLVSISNDQRRPLSEATWIATVYHGLPSDMHYGVEKPGKYLAFLGRISPEKRVDRAIEIAKKAQMPLKVAAKVDEADKEYFQTIKHLLEDPMVEFIGEIGQNEKQDFLGNASALLFPIDWPEPFGLVMIEAMACGTPVIAYRKGSVPEIVDEGVTGFIVNSIDEAADAVGKLNLINRKQCRKRFEERFDVKIMVDHYEEVYGRVIEMKTNMIIR